MWVFLAAVSGAIVGGVLAIVGGYLANRVLAKSQDRRWLAEERLRQRTRTAERLRKLYAPLVQSTVTFQAVAAEKSFVFVRDGTAENRDARHVRELNAALEIMTAVGGELLVDKDAKPIRELYNSFRLSFNSYLAAWESPAGTQRASDIQTLGQELSKLALDVQEFAERQLDELSAPPTQKDLN